MDLIDYYASDELLHLQVLEASDASETHAM